MNMNYYMAKVLVRQCLADIRINDVPIFRESVDADLSTEMPINHHIEFSGSQTLTVKIHPMSGQAKFLSGEMCSVEIWRYDKSERRPVKLEQVCSSTLTVGETEAMLPFLYDKKNFISEVSYTITRWSECKELEDSRKMAPMIFEFYQKVGQMLSNKQFSQYMDFVKDRERKICSALYLGEDEVKRRNQELFEYINNGFVMQPMRGGKRIQYYADKRVVSVLDHDMESTLRFRNDETGQMIVVELLLGIKKGEKDLCII